MKETVGSLRAFFILVGAIGLLNNIPAFQESIELFKISPGIALVLLIIVGSSLVLNLAYLLCGLRLPTMLATNPAPILAILMANLCLLAVSFAFVTFITGTIGGGAIVFPIIEVAITLYLYKSVLRLSAGNNRQTE